MRRFLIGLTWSACLCTAALAAGPATTRAVDDLSTLIARLDADDYHARQAAEDALVAIGEPARGEVAAVAHNSSSAEQRARAAAVLSRLDQSLANQPTLITLHCKDANPRQVFADIAKQAKIQLPLWPETLWTPNQGTIPKVSLDVERSPFWVVVAEVCRQSSAQLQAMNVGHGEHLTVMQGGSSDMLGGPKFISGRFIIVPQRASRSSSVNFVPGVSSGDSNSIDFSVYADPAVKIAGYQYAKLLEATDDKGHSLLSANLSQQFFGGGNNEQVRTMQFQLIYPNDGYTKLALMRGELGVTLATQTKHFELDDVAAHLHTPNRVGPIRLTVDSLSSKDSSASLKVTLGSREAESNDIYSKAREIQLVDAGGQILTAGGSSGSGSNSTYSYTAEFSATAPVRPPFKLSWDVVTETKFVTVPFVFKDLPLPRP